MKFSCEKYILQTACTVTGRATASKSPIPALEGILIEAEDNIRLTGYDLKKGIYTSIEADIAECGKVVLNAKLFEEMIRKMPDGIVNVSVDDKLNVNISCGKSFFNFVGISPEDYPDIPRVEGLNNIEIPEKILKSMINQTIFAVATSDIRPVYTGTFFEIDGSTITLVSIDGYRLAKRTETLENADYEMQSFIVPGSALSDIERICGDSDDKVVISVGEKHISFQIKDTVVVTRRLEGEFLNYRKSIPNDFKYTIKVNRSEFMSVIDRVALMVSEKNSNPVRLKINDGSIYCRCMTSRGKSEDTCGCEGSAEGLEIGFNDRYLMDALKNAGKESLCICLNTPYTPCIIKSVDGTENFTYMILPVRLRAE